MFFVMQERGSIEMNGILLLIYLLFSVGGLTFIKLGSLNETISSFIVPIINLKVNLISLLGYGCYLVSFLVYTVVITKFDLGIIIPLLSGIVNVLIFIVACLVFKETFTMHSIIGILLISVGVVLMNIK